MREFLFYSRTGYTTPNFSTLEEGGRLDILYQTILTSIFKSQSHRHDVVFHAVLNGPKNPPIHIEIIGNDLRDARIDEISWYNIIKELLKGGAHEGISTDRKSFQQIIKEKYNENYKIFILNNKGIMFTEVDEFKNYLDNEKLLFIIGDHVGLPKKDEMFALRYGSALSLGHRKYLAASCIDIINYLLDLREEKIEFIKK